MAGTPQYIRNLNENLIMDALITQGSMSRADISRQTGLSKPTVSSAVEHLIGRNLVKETGRADNAQGRKATLIQFNETAYYVCGVDIGATRIRIALSDLNGKMIAYATFPLLSKISMVSPTHRLYSPLEKWRLRKGLEDLLPLKCPYFVYCTVMWISCFRRISLSGVIFAASDLGFQELFCPAQDRLAGLWTRLLAWNKTSPVTP